MRKLVLIFLICNINSLFAQKMELDSIKLSPNIKLFQTKDRVGNQTNWKLSLENEKENKIILLDSYQVTHPNPEAIIASDINFSKLKIIKNNDFATNYLTDEKYLIFEENIIGNIDYNSLKILEDNYIEDKDGYFFTDYYILKKDLKGN